MLCLIANQHRNVPDLVTGLGVAMGVDDFVERVAAPNHGAQLAGIDQLLEEDEIGLLRIGCAGDESRPSSEVYQPAGHQRPRNPLSPPEKPTSR